MLARRRYRGSIKAEPDSSRWALQWLVNDRAAVKTRSSEREEPMTQPRAADDFAMIRARMEELRREREAAHVTESETKSDPPTRSNRNGYWSQQEISAGPVRTRKSGLIRS